MSDAPVTSTPDRRPAVARAISDRGVWIFAAVLVVGGGTLFGALESRRAGLTAPAIAPEPDSAGSVLASPPELALPSSWQTPSPPPVPEPAPTAFAPPPPPPAVQPSHFAREASQYVPPPVAISTPAPLAPVAARDNSEVVFRGPNNSANGPGAKQDTPAGKSERVEATRFANPGTTVPKGTVMQAVLESALDSTRAGMARAIISRDIYGFDGTKILIPRGSRLIGEYKADLQQGQSRALIEWQRLMRPDGVLINLDSPSADPLGRAGIKGKVNNHFFARYSGAILQSALDIGDQVAINKLAPATTIYATPGVYGLQNVTTTGTGTSSTNIQPTLTVKQGTSVSVFVARDLDFTSVQP